jgi:hypothetical protein
MTPFTPFIEWINGVCREGAVTGRNRAYTVEQKSGAAVSE